MKAKMRLCGTLCDSSIVLCSSFSQAASPHGCVAPFPYRFVTSDDFMGSSSRAGIGTSVLMVGAVCVGVITSAVLSCT